VPGLGRAAPLAAGPFGPLWLVLAFVSAALVFRDGFVSLGAAWATPEYSHGPLIPVVSFWLYLREMRFVPPAAAPVGDRAPGVAAILLALLTGLAGTVVAIPDIVTYGFILWIGGLVLVTWGWRRGRLFWPSVVHLVFMLPLPNFIYWPVSIELQLVSSQLGVWLIGVFGVPVYLEGNVIDLGIYKLQVAEACSGLRYLFPILSFSWITALLYRGPLWHRILLFLTAAPITVMMNSFRIGMIGVLVDRWGIAQAEGFLHVFEGWVIFLACVGFLLLLVLLLQRLTAAPKPLHEALDLDFSGLHREVARFRGIVPSAALALSALAGLALGLALHLLPPREPPPLERTPLALFPTALGPWAGIAGPLEAGVERVLAADDYLSARYAPADGSGAAPVDLFIAFYRRQAGGAGIHSPEVCLPTGGWEVSAWRQDRILLGDGTEVPVNRAVIRKGLARQLVWYWFEGRGRRTTSDYLAKAWTVRDAALTGRSDGALVRLVTPIGPDESEAEASARLAAFLAPLAGVLPRFVPE
jgi:exosortase D (VPLPA-CTERM-specific)